MRAVMLRTARHYSSNAARALATSHAPSSSIPRLSHHRSAPMDFVSWLPSGGGNFLVTYNINNGVQILTGGGNPGRAVPMHPPPSYNEAVRSSATQPVVQVRDTVGPPPPYASRESLVGVGVNQALQSVQVQFRPVLRPPVPAEGVEHTSESSAASPLLPGRRRSQERPPSVLLEATNENGESRRNSSS